jgi:membrane-bound serine protease (ClpP class)
VVVQGKPVRLETSELVVVSVRPGWRDQLLELMTDPSIVYLLLLAGLAGVAFELSHPGVFAPGVIGTICLLVGGYGLNLLPIDYAGLALVLFGLGLMAAEAFLPAFGAFVLGGATAFAIGSMMLFETPGLRLPVELIVGATLAAAALFGLALTLLVRARRRPLQSGAAELIGLQGQVLGCTGREGFALIQGELWRARAVQPLQPGQTVRVVGRDGLTLLVEAA